MTTFQEDIEAAVSLAAPSAWEQTAVGGEDEDNDRSLLTITWTNGGENKGQVRLERRGDILIFESLYSTTGSNLFRNLCAGLPPVARRRGIKHFCVLDTSDQMKTLLSQAGFRTLDLFALNPADEATIMPLIEAQFPFFGKDVWYASVEEENCVIESYGNE